MLCTLLFSCESSDGSYTNTPEEYEEEELTIDCSDAISTASYDYARQAYNSETLEDIQYYAQKAMSEFESTTSYASDCGCDDANYAAEGAYDYARKAYNAYSVEEGEDYARKAMDSADDVGSYASDCESL